MPIVINDPELEQRIEALGRRQRIKCKKTTMAKAILEAAVADDRGAPRDKWKDRAEAFTSGGDSHAA